MEASKTVEELMKGIRSLAENVDWKNEEAKGVICFSYNEGEVMCNAYGKSMAAIYAIFNMMIKDKDIRGIVCSAYKAYIDYSSKNLSEVYGPLLKKMDEVMKEHFSGEPSNLAPCFISAKFKPRS